MKRILSLASAVVIILLSTVTAFGAECPKGSHVYGEYETVKESTCTEYGTEEAKCLKCNAVKSRQKALKSHSYGEWTVTKKPTCTELGEETRKCTVCGAAEKRVVDKINHSYGEWEIITPASCTEKGRETRKCTVCGSIENKTAEPLGHTYGNWKVILAPTATEAGRKRAECLRCGDETEDIIMPLGESGEPTVIDSEGDLPGDAVIEVNPLDESSKEAEDIDKQMESLTDKYEAYEIVAKDDDETVDVNGNYKVVIPLPEDYTNSSSIFYYGKDQYGDYELIKLPTEISEDGKSLSAEYDKLGIFIIANDPYGSFSRATTIPLWVILVLPSLIVVIVAVLMVVISSRKSKDKEDGENKEKHEPIKTFIKYARATFKVIGQYVKEDCKLARKYAKATVKVVKEDIKELEKTTEKGERSDINGEDIKKAEDDKPAEDKKQTAPKNKKKSAKQTKKK